MPESRLIFIFDGTRLRSHLFFRYITTHPDLEAIYHPFMMAGMFGAEEVSSRLHHSAMREQEIVEHRETLGVPDTFDSSREAFISAVRLALQRHKDPIANEHWPLVMKEEFMLDILRGKIQHHTQLRPNPTHIPDDMFDELIPIVLIRHPALSINSIHRDTLKYTKQRLGDEDFKVVCMNFGIRLLFDYFSAQGRQPIVVDGEDIVWRTQDMSRNLCERLDIDVNGLCDTWDSISEDEIQKMHPLVYTLTKNIQHSTGIERPSQGPMEPSIVSTWTEKYGSDVAKQLRELVEANLPHYEYLKQFAGKSVECKPQKLTAIVSYLQKSRVAWNIKDLEKHIPGVASINGMHVKDYLQNLQDESRICVEKIGSGNWYWSFASTDKRKREKALTEAQAAHSKISSVVQDLRSQVEEAAAAREDDDADVRADLMASKAVLEADLKTLNKELEAYKDHDPVELELKEKEISQAREEVTQYTDDIYSMETWFNKQGMEQNVLGYRMSLYGDQFDTEEYDFKEV